MGCLSSQESQRKGDLGTGSGDKPETSCQLPIALEFQRQVPVKKSVRSGEKKGKGMALAAPQRESTGLGGPFLKLLCVSYRQESWGRSQGKDSAEYSSVLQVCPFKVLVSSDWAVAGQGYLVIEVGPGVAHLVLLFLWDWN